MNRSRPLVAVLAASALFSGMLLWRVIVHPASAAAAAKDADTRAEAYDVIGVSDDDGEAFKNALNAKAAEGWTVRAATGKFVILVKGR